jgi:hypothetical protein
VSGFSSRWTSMSAGQRPKPRARIQLRRAYGYAYLPHVALLSRQGGASCVSWLGTCLRAILTVGFAERGTARPGARAGTAFIWAHIERAPGSGGIHKPTSGSRVLLL